VIIDHWGDHGGGVEVEPVGVYLSPMPHNLSGCQNLDEIKIPMTGKMTFASILKGKRESTQTKSAWVKEVWMPQNLLMAVVGPHYRPPSTLNHCPESIGFLHDSAMNLWTFVNK
jgi:hypothetical protein